jgi:hypothetical protein
MRTMMCARTISLGAAALALAACGGGGGFPDAPPIDNPPVNGTLAFSWEIHDTDGAVIPCERVGALSMTATLHELSTAGGFTEPFSCNTGMGVASVAPGTYEIGFELDAPSGIIATATKQTGLVVASAGASVVPKATFTLDATGALDLVFAAIEPGGNGSNCEGGAGIDTMTITLEDASDACTPVTFDVSAGATGTAGTYQVDCAAPVTIGCLENDQRLSVSGVDSGSHQIHVRGATVNPDCTWTNDDIFAVPPIGATLMRTLNLAKPVTGCE